MKQWKFRSRNSKSIRLRDFSTDFQKDSNKKPQININSYKMSKSGQDPVQKTRIFYSEIQVTNNLRDYSLVSWGSGKEGSLGTSSLEDSSLPQTINSLNTKRIVQIVCGAGNTMVLTSDNLIYTWGFNSVGQLGQGHFKNCSSPCQLNFSFGQVNKIVLGAGHCMVLNNSGELFSWGCSGYYQTGHQVLIHQNYPQKIAFFNSFYVSDASCGISHSLVIANSTLFTFGDNFHGQCTGKESYYKVPKEIKFPDIKKIVAGGAHSLILTQNGSVAATGLNTSGQLGLGHKEEVFEFTEVKIKDCVDLFAGEEISAGVNDKGKVFVWGWNGFGQLGQGHFADVLFPSLVDFKERVKSVSMGVAAVGFLTQKNEFYWTGYLGACVKKEMKDKNLAPDKQLAIPQRFLSDAKIEVFGIGRTHCVVYLTDIEKGIHNDSDEEFILGFERIDRPRASLWPDIEGEPIKPVIREKKKVVNEETRKFELKTGRFEEKNKSEVNNEGFEGNYEKKEFHSREKSLDSAIQSKKYTENPLVTLLSFQKAKEEGRELAKHFRLYDDQVKLPSANLKPLADEKLVPVQKKSSKQLSKVKSFEREKISTLDGFREKNENYHFPSIVQSNIMQEQRLKELESMANKYEKRISRYYQPNSPKIKNVKTSKRVGGGYLG